MMSMPESRSDACTAHATNAMACVGLRSSSIDLRASGMYASTTGADGASSMGVGASGGADADAAIGVLTAAAMLPRCSAASRHLRLRSCSSRGAPLVGACDGVSAGWFVVAAAASLTKTYTRSPRAMPHERSVEPSPLPCVETSSVLLSVTATFAGSTFPSKTFVASALRSCARVHTSGTSTRIVSPDPPTTRTRSLMPIEPLRRRPPPAPSTVRGREVTHSWKQQPREGGLIINKLEYGYGMS